MSPLIIKRETTEVKDETPTVQEPKSITLEEPKEAVLGK